MAESVYNVLLVEDEISIREGIRDIIPWASLGYRFAAEAKNGVEALELFDSLAPDLVITDLRMPKMDGLSLISSIRERTEETKIIILTGFDDFGYVRKALQANVRDYLLKPVAPNELIELLRNVKKELDKLSAYKDSTTGLLPGNMDSRGLFRRMVMLKLISGIKDPGAINAYLVADPEIRGSAWFQAILYDYDASDRSISPDGFRAAFREMNHSGVMSELIPDHSGKLIEIAFSGFSAEVDTIPADSIRAKRDWISRETAASISTGSGSPVSAFEDIRKSYESAINSLSRRYVRGGSDDYDITHDPPQAVPKAGTEPILRFLKSVETGSYDEWESRLSDIIAELKEADSSEEHSLELMTLSISAMMNAQRRHNIPYDLGDVKDSSVIKKARSYKTIDSLYLWLSALIKEITDELSEKRHDSSFIVAENARLYIEENYMKSSLALEDVCSYLGVSASTFSRVFKTYLDTTFSTYLTEVRIRNAKKLICRTDLRNKEIAFQIGFSSPHYFSHVFTKFVGYSPSAFRKNLEIRATDLKGAIN